MVTFTGSVILPTGTTQTVSGTTTITAPLSILFGSDREPVSMTTYPGQRYTRVYSPPGSGIKAPSTVSGLLSHVSFKDTPTATMVNFWLTNLPVLANTPWPGVDAIIEYNHEPEGDMSSKTYIANVLMLQSIIKSNPNGHRVRLAQTFTRYAQVHGKNMTDGVPATYENLWCDADLLGFDCEVDDTITGYPTPASFFAPLVTAGKWATVPVIVPELGWPQLSTDPTGSGLAAWYTSCSSYLKSVNCVAVAAYDTNGKTADYVLSGPALAAWQRACAA